MQVTTVSDASVFPKDSGRAAGVRAKPGEFDFAMAALCALLSPTPVGVAQGQINTGNRTATITETGNLNLAGPTVLLEDSKAALFEKKPAENAATGLDVEYAAQTLMGVINPVDLLDNPVLQQNQAIVIAPVQNSQAPINPATGAGKPIQQSAEPKSPAIEMVPVQNSQAPINPATEVGKPIQQTAEPKSPAIEMAPVQNSQAPINPATGAGKPIQQSVDQKGQVVFAQFPVVAENATVLSASPQPEPGVAPPEVLSGETSVGVKLAPDPSQKVTQLTPEMVGVAQEQLKGAIQEPVAKNKQKTTLVVAVAGDSKPATEDEQTGILKAGSPGTISSAEKPEIKDLQDARPAIALSLNQAVQPVGKEIKPGAGKDEAVKTLSESGTAGAGEKKKQFSNSQSNTTQHSMAQFNATQSSPAQLDQSLPAQSTGDASKGVGLPDLKDRLLQEIKHIFTINKGEPQTHVQLKLEPEHLGQLTIKLFFNKGELSAHFYTGNSYVKDALEGSIQQLRDTLGQQDLKLNEALVFTGGDGRGGMGSFFDDRNGREASAYGGTNQRTYGDAQVEPTEFISTETDTSRVNYLI